MKIYTKTGDKGMTSLVGGKRVSKSCERLESYGEVDELNSFLGLLIAKCPDEHDRAFLISVQRLLFSLGGYLATEDNAERYFDVASFDGFTSEIENEIDAMSSRLPQLRAFILPGGQETACLAHVCRTICRRVERSVYRLVGTGCNIDDGVTSFLNRLSDYFFVLARKINTEKGSGDVIL